MASTITVDNIIGKTATDNIHIPGHVVQVQENLITDTDTLSLASQSWTPINFGINISPKYTNSKIVLDFSVGQSFIQDANNGLSWCFARNGTRINHGNDSDQNGEAYGSYNRSNTGAVYFSPTSRWVDYPNTTSNITYDIHTKNGSTGYTQIFHIHTFVSLIVTEIAQ